MQSCASILEEVIALCRVERQALADEDFEKIEEIAARRLDLLQNAWDYREGCHKDVLLSLLVTIRNEQKALHAVVEELHENLRKQQRAGRKQGVYLNQDRHTYAQLNRSFYCNKIS